MAWKSEWASQWKVWDVCTEGAGKEYNAPNSAFFVNAEICEKILKFPMPEPIFYEHLLIDNKKMSASVGNVIYPHEWLEVSRPEALKYLYMKKLAKTRSFSWQDLPKLEAEFDKVTSVALGKTVCEDKKEEFNQNKLYVYSLVKGRKPLPLQVDFSTIASFIQLFPREELISKLESCGLIKALSKEEKQQLEERISHAMLWLEKHAPADVKLKFLDALTDDIAVQIPTNLKPLISEISSKLPQLNSADDIQSLIFNSTKIHNIKPAELFKALYLLILGKPQGPKIGTLVLAIGKDKIISRLKQFCSS